MLGYAHWIFGKLVFSLILFTGTLHGLGVIAKYVASGFLRRTILLVKLASIKQL